MIDDLTKKRLYIRSAIIGEIAAINHRAHTKRNIEREATRLFEEVYSTYEFESEREHRVIRAAFFDGFTKECEIKDIVESDIVKYKGRQYYVDFIDDNFVHLIRLRKILKNKFKVVVADRTKVKKFTSGTELKRGMHDISKTFNRWFGRNHNKLLREYRDEIMGNDEFESFVMFIHERFEKKKTIRRAKAKRRRSNAKKNRRKK